MKIKIIGLNNFDEKEVSAIKISLIQGEPVINSDIFKSMILDGNFTETRNMSNSEIYNILMGGTIIQGIPQGDMELDITGYMEHSSSIGYTLMKGLRTFFNRVFLDKYDSAEIFHNIVHEYCHTLGFYHNEWWHKSKSVPYQVGYIAGNAFNEYYKSNQDKIIVSKVEFV